VPDPWGNDPDRTTRKEAPVQQERQPIMTDDWVIVYEGDRVYNYYDMWPGTIVPGSIQYYNRGGEVNIHSDLWFDVQRDGDDERDKAMLNGARICTIEFAKDKGWPRI
jgi:hypothetical protein